MKNTIFNNKLFGLSVVFALLMTSCSDNFLDVAKDDTVNAATFYKTEADVKLGVAGVYELLTDGPSQRYHVIGKSLWTDDIWRGGFVGPNFDYEPVAIGTHSSNTRPIEDMWVYFYKMIRRGNDFLKDVQGIDMEAALLDRYRAEVRFLRAYAYQELVFLYGDVPFFTETPGSVESRSIGRTSKSEIIDFVVSELGDIYDDLPASYSAGDVGRITRGASAALLSRVHLFNENYSASVQASNQVISSGDYALENFGEVFLLGNENNEEVIFDAQYLDLTYTNWIANYTLPGALGGWGGTPPSQSLVDAFEMQGTGLPITDPASGYDPNDPYAGRDPRLGQAIAYPGAVVDGVTFNGTQSITGYSSVKYYDPEIQRGYGFSQNYIIIRYAEVLLNFAEATNEASGPNADVYEAVNLVRSRASMPDLPDGLSQAEMRERIRNERRVELALEGDRFYSIRRWKLAEIVVPQDLLGIDPATMENVIVSSGRVFNPDKHYLWPIPQTQVDFTLDGVTTQNPNW